MLNSRVTSCLLQGRDSELSVTEHAIEILKDKPLEFWCEASQIAQLPMDKDFKAPLELLQQAVSAPSISKFRSLIHRTWDCLSGSTENPVSEDLRLMLACHLIVRVQAKKIVSLLNVAQDFSNPEVYSESAPLVTFESAL